MATKYRAAIVGLGQQARNDYIPGFAKSNLASIAAVCDPNTNTLNNVSQVLGVPGYANHEDLLSTENLDFVLVTAPHSEHRAITESAAKASVHVLKEKPFATSLEEAVRIKAVSEQHDIQVMTTLQRRFNPIHQSYFQLVNQIGDPFFVDARYTMYIDAPHVGWRGSKEVAGGGCVIDMGYHMLDLLIWYLGMPVSVAANTSCEAMADEDYNAEDTASLLFQWEGGLHGTCVLSRFVPPKTELIRVVGNRGIVEVERSSIRRLTSSGEVADFLVRERKANDTATDQIDYFCGVLDGDRPNIGDPNSHLQHAALVEACYQSVSKKSVINPSEVLSSCSVETLSPSMVAPAPFGPENRTSSGLRSMRVHTQPSLNS